MSCQQCFYIDRRLGVGQPPGFPFNVKILRLNFSKFFYKITSNEKEKL